MSTSTSAIFSGNSRYAADFQSIIERGVAIASLPLSQLNDARERLTEESTAITELQDKFASVETALDAVNDALSAGSYQATVSDTGVAAATVSSGAMEGTYSIEVISTGSYATSISADSGPIKVTNPNSGSLSLDTSFTLTVGSEEYTITPEANTLSALAAAINAETDADVRATIVNVGSAGSPDYRLSLQGTRLGANSIRLSDTAGDLLTAQTAGSMAQYKVNGVQQVAESDSRSITLAPGLTVDLLGVSQTGQATSITVTRGSAALGNAFASLANAYNAAMGELDKHRGQGDGALTGQDVIYSLAQGMRQIISFDSGGEGISSLGELGFSFERTGYLTFDSGAFYAADFAHSGEVAAFLGDATSGGFIQNAADTLKTLSDPVSGQIRNVLDSITRQIDTTDARIAEDQARVEQLQTRLQEQMAAADALIASLEQQYNVLSSMFEAMRQSDES